jgi:hypothetical protein
MRSALALPIPVEAPVMSTVLTLGQANIENDG